jgi:hypothetical protein
MTKIYPFRVSYRTATGAFAAIDDRLVASGSGYAQQANDLGVFLPGTAAGAGRVSDSAGGLSFGLQGASGSGSVSGTVESFSAALPGVDLAFASENSGVGWQAHVAAASVGAGLSWLVAPSIGLSARLVSGGVAFENSAGKTVWVFTAPTARIAGSGRPLASQVSLTETAQGTLIHVAPLSSYAAGSRSSARLEPFRAGAAVAVPGAVVNPNPIVWSGQVVPGNAVNLGGSGQQPGDCYVDVRPDVAHNEWTTGLEIDE